MRTKLAKLLAFSLLAETLVAGTASASVELKDIDNSYAKTEILKLVDMGIINGTGGGSFKPSGNIKRQDFAIIMAKALNLDLTNPPATPTFSEIPPSHYSYAAVEALALAGYSNGIGNGKFGGTATLSRQEMAVLFVRVLGADATGYGDKLTFADAGSIAGYAKDAVGYVVELGLMKGTGGSMFQPQGLAERQQVALVASNFLKIHEEKKAAEAAKQAEEEAAKEAEEEAAKEEVPVVVVPTTPYYPAPVWSSNVSIGAMAESYAVVPPDGMINGMVSSGVQTLTTAKTVNQFLEYITKGESHQTLAVHSSEDELLLTPKSGDAMLAEGDRLIVTAQNGAKARYSLVFASSNVSISSMDTSYVIDPPDGMMLGTISGQAQLITTAKTVNQFLQYISKGQPNQTLSVHSSIDELLLTPKAGEAMLAVGDVLLVTAENGTTKARYSLNVTVPSNVVSITSTGTSYSISAPVDSEPGTIGSNAQTITPAKSVTQFLEFITKGEANQTLSVHAAADTTFATPKAGTDLLVAGDRLIVTAQDGTTKARYLINLASTNVVISAIDSAYTIVAPTVNEPGTIAGNTQTIATLTTVSQLLGNIAKGQPNQTLNVYEFDDLNYTVPKASSATLAAGDMLVVTAQDGTTRAVYTFPSLADN